MGRDFEVRQNPELELRQEMRRTILLVDDEEVIRDLCARTLSEYRILQAGNGREALEVLEQEPVDLVLSDVMMPEMSGLELLETIRKNNPDQAVVLMTGFGEKELILRALKANADDFIQKPVNLLQLKTSVQKVLEQHSLRYEIRQLKRMDQLKSEFLGLISHKLKTPVTAISLIIQNLADDLSEAPVEIQEQLRLTKNQSQLLADLIEELLGYGDTILDMNPTDLESLQLVDLLQTVLTLFEKGLQAKQLDIAIELPQELPTLPLDRRRTLFALRAILDNAVKFSPMGGVLTLHAELSESAVQLSISDQGPGIPREELPKVFEKFYQVDPDSTGQVRGFGLGLFYAKQFLRDQHAKVELTSPTTGGTTATITFPRV
ncbi:MAG: hybrid sensor histidine kinase/response regulator [Desulfuromonas sp.]|nr:MAG: hybrid sensor histidine kinase/response regulator [Desulfuromonas sp.]